MRAYIYQAALWCENCAQEIKARLDEAGRRPENPDDEWSFDSDEYPKGPYSEGGGEADCPQHCDGGETCLNAEVVTDKEGKEYRIGVPLENSLTEEGIRYVRESVGEGTGLCCELWRDLYPEAFDDEETDDEEEGS